MYIPVLKFSVETPPRKIRAIAGLKTENLANRVLSKSLKHFYSLLQRRPNKSGKPEVALPTRSLASLGKALQNCMIQEAPSEGVSGKKQSSSQQCSHISTNAS